MKTVLFHTCTVVLIFMAFAALPATAQSPTPERVYTTTSTDSTGNGASIVNGFTQTSSTGSLSSTTGSPYAERLDGAAMAVDVKGRFLFVANPSNNSISMFQIDSSTGALTEVPTSPFASGPPSVGLLAPATPRALVGEPSGQYLYVGYQTGSATGESAVVTYVIDAVHLALVPLPQSEVDQSQQTVVAMLIDARGRNLYVTNSSSLKVYQINPSNGALTLAQTPDMAQIGRSLAMDPQNRFLYYGRGQNEGLIDQFVLSPIDSLPGPEVGGIIVGTGTINTIAQYPLSLAIENTGTFIYALAPAAIYTYAIDQTSGNLSVASGSPPLFVTLNGLVADPQGPYLYASSGAQIRAYQVNAQTGLLTEIAGSPFGTGTGLSRGLVFAGPPQSGQAISGPAPVFDSNQEGFSSLVVGATSGTLMDRLGNNGDQPLLISSITLGGANPGDFHETNNCPLSLSGNVFCTISLTFTPGAIGSRQALLIVADNGPGGSQSIALSGTGLSGTPAVTLSSGSLTFSTIPALTTSPIQNVTVTNSGTAPLHVSNVALSGANPGDFSLSNGCTAAVAIGGNCVIGVTFAPVAAGQRTSQVVIGDDAANSPQTVSLTGNATSPFTVAPSSSSSATVKAGQPVQYSLNVAAAAGFSGTAQVQCINAIPGATCMVPATVQVISGSTSPFTVSVTTTAGSLFVPFDDPASKPQTPIMPRSVTPRLVMVLMLLVSLVIVLGAPAVAAADWRRAWQQATLALALCAILVTSGCGAGVSGTASSNGSSNGSGSGSGGGSNGGSGGGTNPASSGTPAGSYTLTVTVTVGTVSVPTQLTLIVN